MEPAASHPSEMSVAVSIWMESRSNATHGFDVSLTASRGRFLKQKMFLVSNMDHFGPKIEVLKPIQNHLPHNSRVFGLKNRSLQEARRRY